MDDAHVGGAHVGGGWGHHPHEHNPYYLNYSLFTF